MKRFWILAFLLLLTAQLAQAETNLVNGLSTSGDSCVVSNWCDYVNLVYDLDSVIKVTKKDGSITNLVKKLVESGEVCAVVGHRWGILNITTLLYRPDGNYPLSRKCDLCGRVEVKQPEEWKAKEGQ